MIKVDIDIDASGVLRMLDGFGKQLPFALQTAINNTAFDVRKRISAELASRLERPTRFTTGSARVTKATKANLTATVYIDPAAAALLSQQFTGGARRPKRYEAALQSQGLLGANEFTTPGAGVRIDGNGNIAKAQLLKILQALKGEKAGQRNARKRKARRAGTIFWSTGDEGRLPKGAWLQVAGGVKPLLMVVRSPRYVPRVPFRQIVQEEFKRSWPGNAQAAVSRAIATAK